jgi:RHS repeat-associated protein
VDGLTSATNNQASWIGDGWDLNPGFVERSYGSCLTDKEGSNPGQRAGDLCWRSDNATASYGSGGGMLIRDSGSGTWRPKADDGARVERFTDGGNGDNDGEHWKITTIDGTQYFYGSRPEARSTWTVPVFGDDSGEPCHQATFDASHCTQAWRWNLDKVVDRHGNLMIFDYDVETNSYGLNVKDAAVSYVRGGTLKQIEYGLRTDRTVAGTGRVVFSTADRCIPGSTCTFDKVNNWPDTALAERCVVATCKDHYSPTFWSTRRLASITTQVRRGSSYADVDRWTLEQSFPDPGDGEKAALWLRSITHTGLVDGSISLPPVTFAGAQLPNRVYQADGLSPLIRYRITGIVSESGGVTSVNYAPAECTSPPARPETNTKRCFPVRWAKPDHAERLDYFHKYVVESVVSSDRIAANPQQIKRYEYLGGAAWHYDTSEFTPPDKKTWNEFRGFGQVRSRTGAADEPSGPVTLTEQRFYRGMHGDKLPNGETRTVDVADSEGGRHTDHDWLAGTEYESIDYVGDGGAVATKSINIPYWRGPTATRGSFKAYIVRPGSTRAFTALESGGWQIAKTETSYDDLGLPIQVNDLGNEAIATDDRCSRNTYVRNAGRWLMAFPARIQTVSAHCGQTPVFPADAMTDTRAWYDGQTYGAAPTVGNVTVEERLTEHPASGPLYYPKSRASYDIHGRVVEVVDALGHTTRAGYQPAIGGPLTRATTTNALGHTGTVDQEPAWGLPVTAVDVNNRVTEVRYDALGRSAEVWQPNRSRANGHAGNARFTYQVRQDAPTVITSTTIGPNGRYTTKNTLYDGLYRIRQTQQAAAGGGRLIVDTRYDSHGRATKSTQPYVNDSAVDTELWVASEVAVPGLTVTQYDGAGRQIEQIFRGGAIEKWRTSTRYGGDRIHTTPPQGGTATTAITDARGQLVAQRQYHGGTPSGPYDETKYTYHPVGHLATVTDPAGSVWRYTHDLRGRQIEVQDPDKGTTLTEYDAVGRPVRATDARGISLAFSYDVLGRRTGVHSGQVTGTKLAGWTYDTAIGGKGALASTTRWVDGNAYTTKVEAYNALGQPLLTTATIPASEGPLAGTYRSAKKYNDDGSPRGESYPGGGGLAEESINHTYDDDSRPLTTTGGMDGTTVTYVSDTQYTRYGEAQRLQLGEGTKRAWLSYYFDDHTRRLKRYIVDAETPRPMVADVNYTYDPAGNVTSIADTPLDRAPDLQCFSYDHLRRLTEAWTPGDGCAGQPSTGQLAGPAPYWQSFGYDKVGNRTSEVWHSAGGDTTRSYQYAQAGSQTRPHAVTSVASSGPAGLGVDEFGYDAAGNTTARKGPGRDQHLTWNDEGQLAKVVDGLKSTEYLYDANGGRMIRRDPAGTTLFLGNQELRLDKITGKVTSTRYYTHGGKIVALRTGGQLTWLAGDHQGTQQVAIDSGDLTVRQRRQTPFGTHRGSPAAFPGDRGFVGGTIEASTGLVRLGMREYDPALGRFLSVDPVIDPKNPQQLNAYAYANNSPVTFSDPTGLILNIVELIKAAQDLLEEWRITHQRSRGTTADRTLRHNRVVAETMKRILVVGPAKIKGFDPKYLRSEVAISGASKEGTGQDGFADIVYDDGVNVYIWEVKSGHAYTPAKAQEEVQHYVGHMKAQYPTKTVQSGFHLGESWTFTYRNGAGKDELVTVTPGGDPDPKGPYPGAVMYTYREKEDDREQREAEPPAIPAPQPNPREEQPDHTTTCFADGCVFVPVEPVKEREPVSAGDLTPVLVVGGVVAVGVAAAASPAIAVGAGVAGLIGWAFS